VLEPESSDSKRSVCRFYIRLALVLIPFLSALTSPGWCQTAPSVRKVVYKVAPKYPRELRQNEIGGIVRLSVVINPNGSVSKVTPVGGNPVLVDAATQAVKQWKYAPSDHLTTTEIQLDFVPRQP
jgi:TonB family protein